MSEAIPAASANTKPLPEHMGVELSAAEWSLLLASFGVGGVCACDGALDYGCPLCTEDQFVTWLHNVRSLKHG